MISCNTRILSGNLTGVQRYLRELISLFPEDIRQISPSKPLNGIAGHIWEQTILPLSVRNSILWSPSISGPLALERQVVTIHDVVPLDHPEWLNPKFASWYRFLTPRLANRVRSILVVSEFTKQRLIYYCPSVEAKINVVPLAADDRFHPCQPFEIDYARSELGIPSSSYIVALGSIEPRKNLKRLLLAWEQIESKIPSDVWLILAGGHGKSLVFGDVSFDKLPKRVHFTGRVDDSLLPALYSGAIATVYPSLYEGFGLPPLEAMACGCPVLTSDVASLPEVVGDAAVKINPLNIDEIAAELLRLIEDSSLRLRLRLLGLEQARSFSWKKTAEDTWKTLTQADCL